MGIKPYVEANALPPEDEAAIHDVLDVEEISDAEQTSIMLRESMALNQVVGDLSGSDLRVPRLQIAYGVGGLAEKFTPGDLVLGGDTLLVKKGDPLTVVIMSALVYWKEYLNKDQYASQIRPRIFRTDKEVKANGGTTEWVNGVGPTFNKAMDLKLLIKQPAGIVCGLFGLELAGDMYAPAVWSIDKSAYRRVGPTVISTATFALKARGLVSGLFEIRTSMEKINNNITVVPSIKLVKHNSDEFVKQIHTTFDSLPAAAGLEGDA